MDHEQRIADALENRRCELEHVAAADGPFSVRAENAVGWFGEHAGNQGKVNHGAA